MLNDRQIRKALREGSLKIDPPPEGAQIQPASVDLTLGDGFRVPAASDGAPIGVSSVSRRPNMSLVEGALILPPQQFALGTTLERVKLPPNLAARVEGKSTVGRLGLLVHATAGFIDPGFEGTITLELYNLAPWAIRLAPGDVICQLAFSLLIEAAERPYGSEGLGSKYQGQSGTVGAK